MADAHKNSGKYTQNYPTERKDYPSRLAADLEKGNLTIEQAYELRAAVPGFRKLKLVEDWEGEDTQGFDPDLSTDQVA